MPNCINHEFLLKREREKTYQLLAVRGKKTALWQILPALGERGGLKGVVGGRLSCLSQSITHSSFPLSEELMLFPRIPRVSLLMEGEAGS